MARNVSDRALAEHLGRTEASVRQRRRRLAQGPARGPRARKGFVYPRRYALERLLDRRPELADIAVTAYLREKALESA